MADAEPADPAPKEEEPVEGEPAVDGDGKGSPIPGKPVVEPVAATPSGMVLPYSNAAMYAKTPIRVKCIFIL